MRIQDIPFLELMQLEPHGPDTYIGRAAQYPWGSRLFGGQVVAQGLRAAAHSVQPVDEAPGRPAHSLHAYFIRPGTHTEPIRYEVERLRDGRSFSTRQVVARQSAGAILNMSVSFHEPEDEADVQVSALPSDLPDPDDADLVDQGWGRLVDRRSIPGNAGPSGYWIRLTADVGDDPVMRACALTFMSDAAPSRTARIPHPELHGDARDQGRFQGASLDHALWFHRGCWPERWHWFSTTSHGLYGARGVVTGDVFSTDGVQVATMAQQVLLRRLRDRS